MATTTTTIAGSTVRTARPTRSLWAVGGIAAVAASTATVVVAAAAHAAGVSLAVSGETIPLVGFAQVTLAASLVGIVLAVCLTCGARHPRRTFVRTTVALTLLSLVPDVLADAGASTRLTLALTHIFAAAIVIPALARRLSD